MQEESQREPVEAVGANPACLADALDQLVVAVVATIEDSRQPIGREGVEAIPVVRDLEKAQDAFEGVGMRAQELCENRLDDVVVEILLPAGKEQMPDRPLIRLGPYLP